MKVRMIGVLKFVSVAIIALLPATCALGQAPASSVDLTAAARAAKPQFHPVAEADLAPIRGSLAASVTRLDERLSRDAANGPAWRKYIELDKLQSQLQQPTLDTAVLNEAYAKFASGLEGLELVWFADVRNDLRGYLLAASLVGKEGLKEAYEQKLDTLAGQLEAYAKQPSADTIAQIADTLQWLENARQAPDLVQAVRAPFVYPNFYAQISGDVLSAGINEPVDRTEPVNDVILGTMIHGMGRTVGTTTSALAPDPNLALFDAVMQGTNYSQTIGTNRGVCIYSCGTTCLGVTKRIWLDADGMHALPAVTCTQAHTTITGIAANRQIIERIAWRKAQQSKPEAEAIASQHAQYRASQAADQQAQPNLDQTNSDYQNRIRTPLGDRKAFPQETWFSTDPGFIHIMGLTAGPQQLAAPTAPPALTEPAEMAVRVHQSMINNMAATVLPGMVLRQDMFQSTVKSMLGRLPDKMKPDPEKDGEPWTMVFAARDPITVSFADNGFTAVLRLHRLMKGDANFTAMNATAVYKFVKTDQGVKAVRQGGIQIFPPGFVPGSGQRLSAPQQRTRIMLEQLLSKGLEPEIVPQGFTFSGKWQSAGKFMPRELTSSNGWLTIGWQRVAAPAAPQASATAAQ